MWIKCGKKSISERAIIGFDHGLPCRVKNMALGPQLRQKPWPLASVFVYWVPRAMFFTRHGRPWSNPTPCSASHTSRPGGRHIYHRIGQVQVLPSSARLSCSRGRIHQSLQHVQWHCCRCPTEGQNSGWYSPLARRRWMGILAYSALHRPLRPQWHCFQPHQVQLHPGHCGLWWVHVDPYRNKALQPDIVCYRRFSCAHIHHWGSIVVRPHQPGRLQSCGGPSDATLQGTAEVQHMVLGRHIDKTIWRFSQVNPWQNQRRCLCIPGRPSYMPEYRLEQEWYWLHTAAEDMLLWHPWCPPMLPRWLAPRPGRILFHTAGWVPLCSHRGRSTCCHLWPRKVPSVCDGLSQSYRGCGSCSPGQTLRWLVTQRHPKPSTTPPEREDSPLQLLHQTCTRCSQQRAWQSFPPSCDPSQRCCWPGGNDPCLCCHSRPLIR